MRVLPFTQAQFVSHFGKFCYVCLFLRRESLLGAAMVAPSVWDVQPGPAGSADRPVSHVFHYSSRKFHKSDITWCWKLLWSHSLRFNSELKPVPITYLLLGMYNTLHQDVCRWAFMIKETDWNFPSALLLEQRSHCKVSYEQRFGRKDAQQKCWFISPAFRNSTLEFLYKAELQCFRILFMSIAFMWDLP